MITNILIFLKYFYAKLFSENRRAWFRQVRKNNLFFIIIFAPFNYVCKKLWLLFCLASPYKLSDYLYYNMFHRHINWDNPKDINEKMQWLKFYSDTSKWTELADKFKVREWIRNKDLEHILNELFAVYKNENEINLSLLPLSFVLKSNNGCRDRLIIKDKDQVRIEEIRTHFRKCKKNIKHFVKSAEHYYLKIKPKVIIAEKLLIDKKSPSGIIIDYKFFCFHGEPKYIEVIYGRHENFLDKFILQIFDMDWNYLKGVVIDENDTIICPKPVSFEEMKKICKILSADFPFVRVDLYEINGKPVFGEMTFTPDAGRKYDYKNDFLIKMGSDIDLTKVTKLEKRNKS